jgi:hypothetical protein
VLLFVGKKVAKIDFFQIFEFIQILKSAKLSKANDLHLSSGALQSPPLTEA